MEPITDKAQLEANIKTFLGFFNSTDKTAKEFAFVLLMQGGSFVAFKIHGDNNWKFAPSRFIGYIENTKRKHLAARKKKIVDGRVTNTAINNIFNYLPIFDNDLSKDYQKYRIDLGLIRDEHIVNRVPKSFWISDIEITL